MTVGLPESVARTCERYLALLDAHAQGILHGLYLVGSVALGDYQDGRSDVDFIALLSQPSDEAAIAALARVHAAMADVGPCFDGVYIDARTLARLPVTPSIVPRSLDGTFAVRECFETNPAVWLGLARHGVRLCGPDLGSLTIAHDPLHLRRFLVGNLQTYWTRWIAEARGALARKRPGETGNAMALAWGVLGVARIACTLATGRIVSKRAAGEWALGIYPDPHHAAIRDALAARRGEVSRIPIRRFEPAFAFMETLIEGETSGAAARNDCIIPLGR